MSIRKKSKPRMLVGSSAVNEIAVKYEKRITVNDVLALSDEQIAVLLEKYASRRLRRGACLGTPAASCEYAKAWLGFRESEIFAAIFLNTKNRVIAGVELFQGSISSCAVTPREVVKTALFYNAASVIFLHNHPSGDLTPSIADEKLTKCLQQVLHVIDVQVLDHIVVSGAESSSFAERGLL